MRHFEEAHYGAAERVWSESCRFSPWTYEGSIGRGLAIAAADPNQANEVAAAIIPQIPRIGDRVLKCDLVAIVGDTYFTAGQLNVARDYYQWSIDIFNLPKMVNTHAQRGLLGI